MRSRFKPSDPQAIHQKFEEIKARALKNAEERDGGGDARTPERLVSFTVTRRRPDAAPDA